MHLSQFSKRPKTPKGKTEPDIETNPDYVDETAGCGCGENCNRSPDDGCPIAQMPVWEFTLPGWRGDTDKYDHLIKWAKAEKVEHVARYLAKSHPDIAVNTKIWPDPLDAAICFGEGLDMVIDSMGSRWVGDIGDTKGDSMSGLLRKHAMDRAAHYSEDAIVRYLDPRPITLEEYKNLRGNSWEFELLLEKYDDEVLVVSARHCLANCQPKTYNRPSGSYDRGFVENYGPLLIERLEQRLKKGKR